MPKLPKSNPNQLKLDQFTDETEFVRLLKEAVVAKGALKGNRRSVTFKLDYQVHAALMGICDDHGITMTDLFTDYVDQAIPVLRKAAKVDVPGYKADKRTKVAVERKMQRREKERTA
jgi:hypothetical protein